MNARPPFASRIETSHDIGMVTAAKLIAICWAGLIPIVFPAWLIVKAEIASENRVQDDKIEMRYATKAELLQSKEDINRQLRDITEHLNRITANQQKVLIKLGVDPVQ